MAMPSDTDTEAPATIIKKYANRRLYNTGTSTYVTLDDLAEMVKGGEDFLVQDAKSGEDLTRSVLTQIIFEQENRGTNLLPITVLRQLIRFYDDSMQAVVPSYLEHSINAFVADSGKNPRGHDQFTRRHTTWCDEWYERCHAGANPQEHGNVPEGHGQCDDDVCTVHWRKR